MSAIKKHIESLPYDEQVSACKHILSTYFDCDLVTKNFCKKIVNRDTILKDIVERFPITETQEKDEIIPLFQKLEKHIKKMIHDIVTERFEYSNDGDDIEGLFP